MVLFILFPDIGTSENVWIKDYKTGKGTKFLDQIKQLGEVFIYTPKFYNHLSFNKKNNMKGFGDEYIFNLEDMLFDNHSKFIYDQIKNNKDEWIPIGLEQGCAYANYFANKYYNRCKALFLIGNRRFTKKNYEKSLVRGERILKLNFGDEYTKYIFDKMNNTKLHKILNTIKEKYEKDKNNDSELLAIWYTISLQLRKQYDDLPIEMKVPTYIYSRITLSAEIAEKHNLKDEKTKFIKGLRTIDEAILEHCKTNMDKFKADNKLIDSSKEGYVNPYYIANRNFLKFIYDENVYKDILDKIKKVISLRGGNYYNNVIHKQKYLKYKQKYLSLKNDSIHSVHIKGGKRKEMKGGSLIFHISGPQGSGKTTLGNKLIDLYDDNIYVKDLDDLFGEFTNSDEKDYQEYIDNFIEMHQDKPLIFVGLDADRCLGPAKPYRTKESDKYYNLHAKHKFYIDLPQEQILKQRFLRQVDKLHKRKEWFFDTWLEKPEIINAKLKRFTDLKGWKLEMESCAELYRERDYKFMHHDDILGEIKQYLEDGSLLIMNDNAAKKH